MEKFKFMNRYISIPTKSKSIRLLLIIFVIIVSILYIMKIEFVPESLVFIVSNNQSFIITSNKQKIQCIIHVKDRNGRFGNRMFIIASAYGLARRHSCHLYLTPEIIKELNQVFIFNLSSLLISSSTFKSITNHIFNPMKKITKHIGCRYIPELTYSSAILHGTIFELKGFWQTYLHFTKYGNELRENIFVATQPVLKKVSKFFIKLYQQKLNIKPKFSLENHQSFKRQLTQSNKTTWIGIHIRRSDFISINYSSSDEYLFNAIKYYTTRYSNAHFIVASDDKSYCKKLFRNQSNIFLTPRSFSVGDDLITLSLCQHSIITAGTFGWWSAYLANGEVVHDTIYSTTCEKDEYYYPPWFVIDENARARNDSNYIS